jgi:hypothetical protein
MEKIVLIEDYFKVYVPATDGNTDVSQPCTKPYAPLLNNETGGRNMDKGGCPGAKIIATGKEGCIKVISGGDKSRPHFSVLSTILDTPFAVLHGS